MRDTPALGALLRGPLIGLTENELLDVVDALPKLNDGPGRLRLWTELADIRHPLLRDTLAILQGLARQAWSTMPFVFADPGRRGAASPPPAAVSGRTVPPSASSPTSTYSWKAPGPTTSAACTPSPPSSTGAPAGLIVFQTCGHVEPVLVAK